MFRKILALLILAFVGHRGYYNRKLAPAEEATIVAREADASAQLTTLLGGIAILSTALYVLRPQWLRRTSLPFPDRLRWLGAGLAIAGFGLLQWSQWTLGRNWSDTPRIMREQEVVSNGPYQWIRHPIYTAFLLILGAPLLISANWLVGGSWLGMTALDVTARMRFEEAAMLARFGEQYEAYIKRTGRLLPRIL